MSVTRVSEPISPSDDDRATAARLSDPALLAALEVLARSSKDTHDRIALRIALREEAENRGII